jgi:hypothetical protein
LRPQTVLGRTAHFDFIPVQNRNYLTNDNSVRLNIWIVFSLDCGCGCGCHCDCESESGCNDDHHDHGRGFEIASRSAPLDCDQNAIESEMSVWVSDCDASESAHFDCGHDPEISTDRESESENEIGEFLRKFGVNPL